jgi:hypothetical protein
LICQRYQSTLSHFFQRLSRAIIGDNNNTAWALQSALAVIIIAGVVLLIRPDFVDYLRSVKLGALEATFADRASNVREAHLNLRDFRVKAELVQYKDFGKTFLDSNSDRGQVRNVFDKLRIQVHTDEITKRLFEHYMHPIIVGFACLDSRSAVSTASQDYDLTSYKAVWQEFLLKIHSGDIAIDQESLSPFLENLRHLSTNFAHRVANLDYLISRKRSVGASYNRGCDELHAAVSTPDVDSKMIDQDASEIANRYQIAVGVMHDGKNDLPEILALTVFEPYLTGVISDLIAFLSDDQGKADFLSRMLDKFPTTDEFVSPGIINLFFQVTDARLNANKPLQLDRAISDIEFAQHGADLMMTWIGDWLRKNPKTSDDKGPEAKQREAMIARREAMEKGYDVFLRNLLATLSTELDVYVQRALANEPVPERHRQRWKTATSRVLALTQARSKSPTITLDGLPPTTLDRRTREHLPGAEIDADFILQADLALALSAILLDNATGKASPVACNTALHYLNEAADVVGAASKLNSLDLAQERRLQLLVAVVTERAGSSCDWIVQRN